MQTFTANEAKTRFGEFLDRAQREPVRVMRHDRVVGVMVSAQDYEAMRAFAPDGLDAALLTAGGPPAERALQGLRPGGRVAYPNGVELHPDGRTDIALESYNGDPDTEIIARLNARMNEAPIQVHVSQIFPLKDAAEAHRAMEAHHLGKMALRVRDFHGG